MSQLNILTQIKFLIYSKIKTSFLKMDNYASCSFLIARKCCPKRKLLHLKHQILPISDRRESTKSASFTRGHLKSISKVLSWCISDSIIKTRLKTARKIGGLPSCQKTFTDILQGYVLCACVWNFRCQVKNADGTSPSQAVGRPPERGLRVQLPSGRDSRQST